MTNINTEAKTEKVKRTAAQTAVLMAILTLISKCLGFVREMVFAGFFGAGYVVDAYVMAQGIPWMLISGVLTAVSVSFLPLFSDKNENESEEAGNRFVNEVMNLLTKTSFVLAIIGAFFAPQFVRFFASGFTGEQATLTVFFLRIAFFQFIFSASNELLTKYLQYKGIFLSQIVFGYVQNICVIAFAVIAAYTNEKLLVFGLITGYIAINVLLKFAASKVGLIRDYKAKGSGVAGQIVALALPTFIGGYVASINTYVDRTLASGLPEGSVSALNYANIILGLITGLTTVIISSVILPRLNQARAQNDQKYYNEMMTKGFNLYALIAVPFTLGAMAFSNEVVQVIYERGAFTEGATEITAIALFWYAPFLCFSQLNQHITYAFQTNKDMKTPMYIGLVTVATNIALNVILVKSMGIAGLAFATSIATFVSLAVGMIVLRRKYPQIQIVESWRKLLFIVASAAASVGVAVLTYRGLVAALWMPRICYLGIAVLAAGIMYLLLLMVAKVSELEMLKSIFKR